MEERKIIDERELSEQLHRVIDKHFDAALARVERVYRQHFASPRRVLRRHWQHRRDIPGDFVAVPKRLWQGGRRWVTRHERNALGEESLSGKEQELQQILFNELLQLPMLEKDLFSLMALYSESFEACQPLLVDLSVQKKVRIESFLADKMRHMSVSREGGRDFLSFLMIGLTGRSLGPDVVFGSAIATGGAVAQSVYLSQQSWWGILWAKWAGVPAWVGVAGGVGGIIAAMAAAPLLSPLAEMAMNRLRGERYLRQLVLDARDNTLHRGPDGYDLAGLLAGYAQIAPDLLVFLKSMVK